MNRVPIASWNPERDVWETGQMDLLSGRLAVFSETWPASGMTRNGVAFELPTWVRPTGENECSLLPTPMTTDSEGLADAPGDAREKGSEHH